MKRQDIDKTKVLFLFIQLSPRHRLKLVSIHRHASWQKTLSFYLNFVSIRMEDGEDGDETMNERARKTEKETRR